MDSDVPAAVGAAAVGLEDGFCRNGTGPYLISLTVTTVRQSTIGHERGGYTMLTSLNGHRGGGFGIGRVR